MGDFDFLQALVLVSARYNVICLKDGQTSLEIDRPGSGSRPVPPASAGLGGRPLAVDVGQLETLAETLFHIRINRTG